MEVENTGIRNKSTASLANLDIKGLEEIMELMRKHGISEVRVGKVELRLGTQPGSIGATKQSPPVTDDQILMNPYAGLEI